MMNSGQRIGSARRALTSEQFRGHARQSVAEFGTTKPAGEAWGAFERALSSAAPYPVMPPARDGL